VEAALWYDAQAPGLGAEFMEEVNSAVQRLSDNPEIHRIRFAERNFGLSILGDGGLGNASRRSAAAIGAVLAPRERNVPSIPACGPA
jgi:hypothetical protein